jgi:hypothetical protein
LAVPEHADLCRGLDHLWKPACLPGESVAGDVVRAGMVVSSPWSELFRVCINPTYLIFGSELKVCLPLSHTDVIQIPYMTVLSLGFLISPRYMTVLSLGFLMSPRYMTVLSLGFLMSSYLKWSGLTEAEVSVYRGVGAITGLIATFLYPWLRRVLGEVGW